MRKLRLLLILFCFSLGLGAGYGLIYLKKFIRHELIVMLDDMVARACGCDFEVDGIQVNLLPLKVRARNPRIVCDGETKLQFRTIRVNPDLSKFRDRTVLLDIELFDGHASGVGSKSAAYRFIDFLAAPLPPELDRPDRWRAKLMTLRLTQGSFSEKFSSSSLVASNIEMDLTRDSADDLVLLPRIGELKVDLLDAMGGVRDSIQLGNLYSKVKITDSTTEFEKLRLEREKSWAEVIARGEIDKGNSLSGELRYFLDSDSYNFPSWISTELTGKANLSGTLGDPAFASDISISHNSSTIFNVANQNVLDLNQGAGSYNFALKGTDYSSEISSISASGESSSAELIPSLTIINDIIEGKFKVYSSRFIVSGGLELEEIQGQVSLSGDLFNPMLTFQGFARNAPTPAFDLNSINLALSLQRDTVEFSVADRPSKGISLSGRGTIKLPDSGDPVLESFKVELKSHPVSKLSQIRPGAPFGIIDGIVTLGGPLDKDSLTGQGEISLIPTAFPNTRIPTTFKLEAGTLDLELKGQDPSAGGKLTYQLDSSKKSSLELFLRDFPAPKDQEASQCLKITADGTYQFSADAPLLGNGSIILKNFTLGCDPYKLNLNREHALPIESGVLSVKGLDMHGPDTFLLANGTVSVLSGYDLHGEGNFDLQSLLQLLPTVDEIGGLVVASFDITGPFGTPDFDGRAEVRGGEFSVASIDLGGEKIEGKIGMARGGLVFDSVSGSLNNGRFAINGFLSPTTPAKSDLNITFSELDFIPGPNSSITLSGDLGFRPDLTGIPTLLGTIDIEGAEFQKKFDMRSLLQLIISSTILRDRAAFIPSAYRSSEALRSVNIDLNLAATRRLYLLTDYASAELDANLKVAGTLDSPVVSGEMNILSGWFGLKDRRFSISSGKIAFDPRELEPQLELIAETTVTRPFGESVLIFIEAQGPLVAPKVTLSSDQGLSERELLSLLTVSSSLPTLRKKDSLSPYSTEPEEITYLGKESWTRKVRRAFKELTEIDRISVEPEYNIQTDSVSPSILGTKEIVEGVELVGRTQVSGSETFSELRAGFDLTDRLTLVGRITSSTSQENTALGVDLGYLLIGSDSLFLDLEIVGNETLSSRDIRKALRLTADSRLLPKDLPKLGENTTQYLRSQGFMTPHVEAKCADDGKYCRRLSIFIVEGPLSLVKAVAFEGEDPSAILGNKLGSLAPDTTASTKILEDSNLFITKLLRSEGYISAKVRARYEQIPDSSDVNLIFDTTLGKPVTFIFSGNTIFSDSNFLETIDLFGRRQPFGSNTKHILLENMESLYQREGYLFSTFHVQETLDENSGRLVYRVDVEEGDRAEVKEIQFAGSPIPDPALRELIREKVLDGNLVEQILDPTYAIDEELAYNTQVIEETLSDQGYQSDITYRIVVGDTGADVIVIYDIITQESQFITDLVVVGLPKDIKLPENEEKFTVGNTNSYVDSLWNALRDHGYFAAELNSDLDADSGVLTISITPGERTIIGQINIEGIRDTDREVIAKRSSLRSGEDWDEERLRAIKNSLLKLGLFSRVDVIPTDGEADEAIEDISIIVHERGLRSLEIGGGVDSEYGIHAFGEGVDRALFGNGKSVALRFDVYYDAEYNDISKGLASLRYSDPFLLDTDYRLTEDLRFQRLENANLPYDTNRVALASYVDRRWDSGFEFSLGHTILNDDLSDVEPDVILSSLDTGNTHLSFLSGTFLYDARDNVLNPSRGFNAGVDYKLASEAIASEANYMEMGGRFSFLYPITRSRFSLANNVRAALAEPFGATQEIPITERYFLGGNNTVRGFRENSLGPKGSEGNEIGGDTLLQNNFELRYRLAESTSVHIFFDAGNVYLRDRSFAISDLRTSAGVGFYYLSPVGPIGFNIGHPLDEMAGEPSVRFHFNIGANF